MDMRHDLMLPLKFDRAAIGLAGYQFKASRGCIRGDAPPSQCRCGANDRH
jgi:hypothetical protein